MGKFSKIFHHIESKDLRNKHEQKKAAKIEEEKKKEDTKKYIASAMEQVKYNWRSKIDVGEAIREGMTTADVATISSPANPDEVLNDTPLDNADDFAPGARGDDADFYPGNVGTAVKSGGSGSGNNGGFDIGNHLAFDGEGSSNGASWMITQPIDTTNLDHIVMSIITGNDSNGGETPDDSDEGLHLYYKTPEMNDFIPINYFPTFTGSDYRGGDIGYPDLDKLISTTDGPTFVDHTIIPVGGGSPTLQDYSKYIPSYARGKGTQFLLYQFSSSGTGKDNYGVKNISYRRKYPIQVVAPLDTPEASSFIRGAEQSSTPKKRKKAVDDKLEASDEYTTAKFGNEFPGQEVRVGGEDPFKSAKIGDDVKPSPQTKEGVKKSFADFQKGDERAEVIKTPEQIQAENDQYFEDLNNLLVENEYDYTDPQVLEITDKILKNDPKNIDAYYYKSAYYDVAGDIEGARKVVDEMVKNNPDSPDGYALRSFYRQEEGDLAGAIEDLEKTVELDPDAYYVAQIEMELADLKFQEAEVEKDNAERERIESEAAAIQEKAHKDYWDNADLIEQEQEEVQELPEYEFDSTNIEDRFNLVNNITNSYFKRTNVPKEQIPSLHRKAAEYASTRYDNLDQDVKDLKAKGDSRQLVGILQQGESWEGSVEEYAELLTDWATGRLFGKTNDLAAAEYYNQVIKRFNAAEDSIYPKIYIPGTGDFFSRGQRMEFGRYKLSQVQNMSPDEIISEFEFALRDWNSNSYQLERGGTTRYDYLYTAKTHNAAKYLKALSDNLPDYYFSNFYAGIFDAEPKEPINTLYDQMKALYDEEDPEKEIRTELKAQGYDKQYKDLMTAWDSADKFSKFITPLKNLSDALLGSKTAQNAKYENYKIAIAKSIMLNKPIRVNPDTIDPALIKKLGDRITPNQILDYDEEQRHNAANENYRKLAKEGKINPTIIYDYEVERMMQGSPVIPIVSEPVPYADENIYEDEFGRVFTNDGSVANNTFQPEKAYHGFASAYVNDIMETNPIAGRGQAQYQIVVPPDGTEPYLLYKDHAYHNVKSDDKGEVPFFANKGAAGFVNWLGNTAHARSDGDANTGGMAGYPPNIRGDVITEFRINLTDLPEDVQGAVYRHPLMTEQPDLVQALKDTLYNEKNVKTIAGSKNLHNLYTGALKAADAAKDWVVDNAVETIMGQMPGAFDFTTASNLLQKYDDYIQQTVHTPDGKTYVPGYIDADGNISQRIDLTDQLTSRDTKHLEKMMFGTGTSPEATLQDKYLKAILKGYNYKTVSEKAQVRNGLITQLKQQINKLSGEGDEAPTKEEYSPSLSNSLGKGLQVDVDEFLKGKLVIKKSYVFRHDDKIDSPIANGLAKIIDVSNDTIAAGGRADKSLLLSLVTMNAARQLLRPVRGPGNIPGTKQSFAQAMNTAPMMPYKVEIPLPQYLIDLMNDIKDDETKEDKPKDGSDLGSAGEIGGVDAATAATLAAERRKKNNRKVNESNLYERLKKRPFFNKDDIKPEFPENPPPKLDPKTGMHPQYGKKAGRYKKLDPISANSMPPTGDPEIDAVVNKQKTINKIKNMAKNK